MSAKITIDRAGRVVIPKPIRRQLHIEPGDSLELETFDDRITLTPVRELAQLVKKQGLWVYQTGKPMGEISIVELIDQIRAERDRDNLR